MSRIVLLLRAAVPVLFFFVGLEEASGQTVSIYSLRQEQLLAPVLAQFEAATGITTRVVYGDGALIERTKREGRTSPADLVISNDFVKLVDLQDAELTEQLESPVAPELLRVLPNGGSHWLPLTIRARVIFANAKGAGAVSSYEDLATAGQKICVRSGLHNYNITLFSYLLTTWGEQEFRAWLAGVKRNLGRKPNGNDRDQIRGIHAGICDVSIGNSYYLARMQADPKQSRFAEGVQAIFPDPAQTNVSGVALLKHSRNKAHARQLVQYLLEPSAQQFFADSNFEYPIRTDVASDPRLAALGTLKAAKTNYDRIARNRAQAIAIVIDQDFDQ